MAASADRYRRVFGQRRNIDLHDVGDVGQQLAAQRATGVGAGEIVGAETARVEQGDRQCIAEGQCRGGAGGRGQVQRAGFLVDAGVEVDVGFLGERGGFVAGDGDQLAAEALHQRHDGQQLVVLARIGNGDQHVVAGDHAQVAMHGLGGMDEIGRGAGAGEGGGQLARDVAGLADAADDDAAATFQDQRDGGAELRPDAPRQRATAAASISSTWRPMATTRPSSATRAARWRNGLVHRGRRL
jgi:hypothetical protein